ncbi:DNA polymerase II large subunit [Candidatus Woesearchaeota archaeon]|nr:DNA polymerase II large subunit [Candidatus Woesearchaeota archaeon]
MAKDGMACSPAIKAYFDDIERKTKKAFEAATEARQQGYDPERFVEVKLAKNMAERVVGIISVAAPQIIGSGVTERIIELEKEYGLQDWRVAFVIALEIARQRHCSFKDELEAIEVGVRTGFAYVTVGVVSSPLEGLTSIDIKRRRDGRGSYFCLNYAGPIRNAGGTAAAVSVLIADYVRKHLGYAKYDPDEKEVQRCYAELEDYHQYVANLQYYPFKEESEFLMRHIPVEIAGDPSEKREVSNVGVKDLPRVQTNHLRSGYCLIHSSCIPLKAPKLWKQISKWKEEMGMEDWEFLEEHIKLQKELKAKQAEQTAQHQESDAKIKPDGTFVADLVGGRPVLGHPMRSGGFRLRYGRSRASGYSGQATHPATLAILNGLIATGTQLKVERPGKAAAFTTCDTLMGPIVKLDDGSVVSLRDEATARELSPRVKEILYLGDALINYGDFFDRAHVLVPPGYVEEFWALEAEESLREHGDEPDARLREAINNPLSTKVSFSEAKSWSSSYGLPLHPSHLFFYAEVDKEQLLALASWLGKASFMLGGSPSVSLPLPHPGKRTLELLGVPHRVEDGLAVVSGDDALALTATLRVRSKEEASSLESFVKDAEGSALSIVQERASFIIKDKSGLFIGARMGRPEKAKMRKMTGSPHTLFPVGAEGGRLRSFQSALEKGLVTAEFPVFLCPECGHRSPFSVCDKCGALGVRQKVHPRTEDLVPPGAAEESGIEFLDFKRWGVPIRDLFDYCLRRMGTKVYPDLVKGVRGTVGKDHTPEHLLKGILRAKHDVYVNKDGTVRYDASEVALTHFKPKEVGTPVARLRELGYTKDNKGEELRRDDQVLELRAQDVVLPACPDSPDEGSDKVLVSIAKFLDELLVTLYGLPPFYNVSSRDDLVGHIVVGLAPHTSAGVVGRIIGFSKTQGFFAHPLYHAAMRRDCDGDESCFFLLMDAFMNFSRRFMSTSRGSTMDAPLVLTTLLNPAEVDDMAFKMDIADHYPLEFYRACQEYKMPWDVSVRKIGDVLFTPAQFEGMRFTHGTDDINAGVLCSAYKLLPSMGEKIAAQMDLAEKLRAVDTADVARLVIEKHFIRDTKGNLRKFSLQQFRCVQCNEKFRRPPLNGRCSSCGGKVIFTISEGSVTKYLEPSLLLAEKYDLDAYLRQTLELTRVRVESYFGKEKEKQTGLAGWLGGG